MHREYVEDEADIIPAVDRLVGEIEAGEYAPPPGSLRYAVSGHLGK
ncbi:MAG: hypothetical protein ACJ72D_11395 [Marmoricola sp.]